MADDVELESAERMVHPFGGGGRSVKPVLHRGATVRRVNRSLGRGISGNALVCSAPAEASPRS